MVVLNDDHTTNIVCIKIKIKYNKNNNTNEFHRHGFLMSQSRYQHQYCCCWCCYCYSGVGGVEGGGERVTHCWLLSLIHLIRLNSLVCCYCHRHVCVCVFSNSPVKTYYKTYYKIRQVYHRFTTDLLHKIKRLTTHI